MSRLRRALGRLLPTHHTVPAGTVPTGTQAPAAEPSADARGATGAPDATGATGDTVGYAPQADGEPDPGEVVWGWVPYDDDPAQGKDRPVLLLGRRGDGWLGLMLTSQDHDRDAAEEARWGRYWMDVGSGGWDRDGRPSEVRLDRLLELPADAVRREGAALPRDVFDAVLAEARRFHPLP